MRSSRNQICTNTTVRKGVTKALQGILHLTVPGRILNIYCAPCLNKCVSVFKFSKILSWMKNIGQNRKDVFPSMRVVVNEIDYCNTSYTI